MSKRKQIVDFSYISKRWLIKLGNENPKSHQIKLMSKLLSTTIFPIERTLLFDQRLTSRETACLMLAAQGLTSDEIVDMLGVENSTIKTFRKKVIEKLECTSMAQAVFEGIRFGYLGS